MEKKKNKSIIKEKERAHRKKLKRVLESRSSIKAKSREKGKIIKAYQDRHNETQKNRDDWKAKCKEKEKECDELNNKYKYIAGLFEMKEEELRQILKEFEELKKKSL